MLKSFKYEDAGGRSWYPYNIIFDAEGVQYCVTLWAISFEHAQLMLEDLRQTGRVEGQIMGEIEL